MLALVRAVEQSPGDDLCLDFGGTLEDAEDAAEIQAGVVARGLLAGA